MEPWPSHEDLIEDQQSIDSAESQASVLYPRATQYQRQFGQSVRDSLRKADPPYQPPISPSASNVNVSSEQRIEQAASGVLLTHPTGSEDQRSPVEVSTVDGVPTQIQSNQIVPPAQFDRVGVNSHSIESVGEQTFNQMSPGQQVAVGFMDREYMQTAGPPENIQQLILRLPQSHFRSSTTRIDSVPMQVPQRADPGGGTAF